MDYQTISNDLTISGQISSDDLKQLSERGVKTLIVNRPDGEGPDQPNFEEIKRQAEKHGITAFYLPVKAGAVTDGEGKEFGQLLNNHPLPAHAYCRTGMRSLTLWALSQSAAGVSFEDINRSAEHTGFDISGL